MTTAVSRLVATRQAELAVEYGGANRVPTHIGNPSHVHKWLQQHRYAEYRQAEREDDSAFREGQQKIAERIRESV